MSAESHFEDLNIDAVTGAELMSLLGLSQIDLGTPARFARLQQVIDFLKQYPPDTQMFLVNKVSQGKTLGDKLDKVFEYTQLLQKKTGLQSELDLAKKGSTALPPDSDPLLRLQYAQREVTAGDSIKSVDSEIARYEQ